MIDKCTVRQLNDMQSYVESKLIGVHRMTLSYRFGEKCATLFSGVALSIILPYLHIGNALHIKKFVEYKDASFMHVVTDLWHYNDYKILTTSCDMKSRDTVSSWDRSLLSCALILVLGVIIFVFLTVILLVSRDQDNMATDEMHQ